MIPTTEIAAAEHYVTTIKQPGLRIICAFCQAPLPGSDPAGQRLSHGACEPRCKPALEMGWENEPPSPLRSAALLAFLALLLTGCEVRVKVSSTPNAPTNTLATFVQVETNAPPAQVVTVADVISVEADGTNLPPTWDAFAQLIRERLGVARDDGVAEGMIIGWGLTKNLGATEHDIRTFAEEVRRGDYQTCIAWASNKHWQASNSIPQSAIRNPEL